MNLKMIKYLCKSTQEELIELLTKYLEAHYDNVLSTPSYIIAEGQIPVALIAHLDTVGQAPPREIYYDSSQRVMWSPQLLGADDRAGIYAIIQIIEAGYLPHVIFTTDEECGGLGALDLARTFPNGYPFGKLKCLIELDRQGRNDCVFYRCANPDFEEYINKFGFKTSWGTFTDISILAPTWHTAAVNLSVGYLREHSVAETLNMGWLHETIKRVIMILEEAEKEMDYYTYIEDKSYLNKIHWNGNRCPICDQKMKKKRLVHDEAFGDYKVCEDCYNQYFLTF